MTYRDPCAQDSYITLNWYDVQEMLEGHHPLTLLKIIMQHEAPFNPPSRLELGDQLNNAEYLCKVLEDLEICVADLEPISEELYVLTKGLTTVVDSVVEKVSEAAKEKGLCRQGVCRQGVWRKKGLSDREAQVIKRDRPIKKGANYADPENKAFPLDTLERVKASHAYIHKYWNSGAKSGITATYSREKFLQVHKRIMIRMNRLGIEHNTCDSLDRATKRHIKRVAKNKMQTMKKGGNSATPRGNNRALTPDMVDFEDIRKLRNVLSSALSDHIIFMKNYISACDERNDGLASSMDESINKNSREILGIFKKHLPGYEPDEPTDTEGLMKQFMSLWDDYLDATKHMIVGGDTGNDGMSRDGLRRLFLVKNELVKYFISVLSESAEEKELDDILTSWVTHLQGYIESRDNDDFATSYQHLQDWQKAKDELAAKLATWMIDRDFMDQADMPEPRELDLDEEVADSPVMGKTTNPPAPLQSPVKAANDVRRDINNPGAEKSVTAVKFRDADTTSPIKRKKIDSPVYGKGKIFDSEPRRPADIREVPTGHRPFRDDCKSDGRNGKCYKKH